MSQDEKVLVGQAVTGAKDAFDKLVAKYYAAIFNFAVYNVWNRDDAMDVTQEVFMNAWVSIRNYDANKGTFYTWLAAIARNLCHKAKRKYASAQSIKGRLAERQVEESRTQEPSPEIVNGLETLPEQQREAVVLKIFDDLSTAQIAQILNTTENNVRVLIFRALRKLKQHLNSEMKNESM